MIEVLINPNETCFVERFGLGMRESLAPRIADLDRFLAAIAHETQQEWRDAHPSLHAALADMGWRIQACRPPQAPGLTMALRKHPAQAFTLDQYLDQAILTETQHRVLREAVQDRQRIIVSGATGSAKTSLLGALLQELSTTEERICLLEDDPELLCQCPQQCLFPHQAGRLHDRAGEGRPALSARPPHHWGGPGRGRAGDGPRPGDRAQRASPRCMRRVPRARSPGSKG